MKPNLRDLFEDLDPSIKSLRSWQDKFSDYWTSYSNKRLIGLRTPTGSGKTLIGLLILEQGRRNKKRGVYLTHNYQLMDRIAKEADKLNINHAILGGAKNIKGIEWKNRQKKIYDYTNYNHIIISNYHTFLYTKDFPENIDILLIDDVDLFYDTLREYFSISIKNEGITKKCYSQIVESLSQRNYNILQKIANKSSTFYDGSLIFPYDFQKIKEIINNNYDDLKKNLEFKSSYSASNDILDYYFWYLNDHELAIEPYIIPINNLNIPSKDISRFSNIEKIIILSATMGDVERFTLELGLQIIDTVLINEESFHEEGISFETGERLIFPLNEGDLTEKNPLSRDFIIKSLDYVENLIYEFDKILILCWENYEKELIKKKIKSLKKNVYDFTGRNFDILEKFSKAKEGYLLIANRYFGLDFPSKSCEISVLTRLPTYLNNFDILIKNYLRDEYYYYELQSRRIIQSLGRINRDEKDFTLYYILDPRFSDAIIHEKDFYHLLTEDLKLSIKYSIQKSNFVELPDSILLGKKFINNENGIRMELLDNLKEKIDEKDKFRIDKDILKMTYQYELEGWNYLYKNIYNKAIETFENLIDVLEEKKEKNKFLRKIEFYNYIIYLIYFKLEQKGIEDFILKLKEYEEKIINSEIITWLNDLTLFRHKDIKIQEKKQSISINQNQKKFIEFSGNPELYLGDIIYLEETKSSLDTIKEVLENLGKKQKSSPVRTLAIEFENICKKILRTREEGIYNNLKSNKNLDISNCLQALKGNNYLRNSIFKKLYEGPRSLRNSIIHIKSEEIEYPEAIKYCFELKNGIQILLKEVYFSDMIRQSIENLSSLKKIEDFKLMSDEKLKNEILNKWADEEIEFDPEVNKYPELTSYSGVLKMIVRGKEYKINLNIEHN